MVEVQWDNFPTKPPRWSLFPNAEAMAHEVLQTLIIVGVATLTFTKSARSQHAQEEGSDAASIETFLSACRKLRYFERDA
jgi:hypothetical protein